MLKYKILFDNTDKSIIIPFANVTSPKIDDATDDWTDNIIQTFVNPIVNEEKEAYSPINQYKLIFNFYNGSSFKSDWVWAGFNMPSDATKNIFIKSLFLLEFYDSNGLNSNNYKFSTTLSVYPNSKTGKGSDGLNQSTFTIDDGANELYYIFYTKNFTDLSGVQIDSITGLQYISLYMKSMFLNAETGKVQYFTNNTSGILSYSNYKNSDYFYEIRFFSNQTFGFYMNNVLQTQIILNELVLQ